MIIKKIKGTEMRRFRNDNEEILGIAGTVAELEERGILSHSGTGTPVQPSMWCCIDREGNILDFVQDKEETKLIFMEF